MPRLDATQIENLPSGGGGNYPMAIARHVMPANTDLGGTPDGAWYQRDLNNLWTSSSWGVSLASNSLTLPSGTYLIDWWMRYPPVRLLRVGLQNASGAWIDNIVGMDYSDIFYMRVPVGRQSFMVLPATTQIRMMATCWYSYSGYSGASKGLGTATPSYFEDTIPNVFSQIVAMKLQ